MYTKQNIYKFKPTDWRIGKGTDPHFGSSLFESRQGCSLSQLKLFSPSKCRDSNSVKQLTLPSKYLSIQLSFIVYQMSLYSLATDRVAKLLPQKGIHGLTSQKTVIFILMNWHENLSAFLRLSMRTQNYKCGHRVWPYPEGRSVLRGRR